MKFDHFIKSTGQLRKFPLGGLRDQFKLAPDFRLGYDSEKIKANNPKKAAVLILFYPNEINDTIFLLTKRASYSGTHSAQISFPGGKIEEYDDNLCQTALRETFEEVGIEKNEINILRQITDVYIPPSNFLVTPFMAYSNKKLKFKINKEVDTLIEVSIKDLLDDKNIRNVEIKTTYMDKALVPSFQLNNFIVWGATAMMLSEIKELIKKAKL
tara:strand:+ start:209 stop:847 length:639 start_codon:yes stop_codon:yes gene_type:complete